MDRRHVKTVKTRNTRRKRVLRDGNENARPALCDALSHRKDGDANATRACSRVRFTTTLARGSDVHRREAMRTKPDRDRRIGSGLRSVARGRRWTGRG